ncbi:hypothetical protein PYCCODRAFT_1423076 [Trametes coccinea BRFM310]|uniref:N-acetyltransferase domain-containing protein n=1 Tax=Trametes coccinea (strain BRFM310) TaxID=1353009 RepID=A0A1Y2IYR4_TRAC3|nr:hypothetical protein PYCCODRAFT_1423076 [Trametes coccinea BRFM310]
MPGINVSSSRNTFVMQHNTAGCFLSFTAPFLRRHEASSNIVLAHALKRVDAQTALSGFEFTSESDVYARLASADLDSYTPRPTKSAFWLTVWSQSSPSSPPSLDLVLACVDWTLGDYPIFLWTPNRVSASSSAWLAPRVAELTERLNCCVPPERVFSVFGLTSLVKAFARSWTRLTGFNVEPEPFYAALFSHCDTNTFRDSDAPLPEGHVLRKATPDDLEPVAQLCKEFADDSIFFPLTIERARVEARELISKGLLWVYDAEGDITTICAVTRNSHRVSAITKVYTTPRWRRRGCAEFLVREVTAQLLYNVGKDSVVLYVGHENSAQRVYDRVGFAGLCGKDKPDTVEDSLELGFVGADRGHW